MKYTNLLLLPSFFGVISCGISEEKCIEYTEPFLHNQIPISRLPANHHGKSEVNFGEFPHIALLGLQTKDNDTIWGNCNAALISENFLLTSILCANNPDGSFESKDDIGTYAAFGINDKSRIKYESTVRIYRVAQKFFYPEEKPESVYGYYNNLGLLKLERPVTFNEYIRPACLYNSFDLLMDTEVSATAWGGTQLVKNDSSTTFINLPYSNKNHKIYLDLFEAKECEHLSRGDTLEHGYLNKLLICTGGRNTPKTTCSGGEGTPLQLLNKDRNVYEIIGIASHGIRAICSMIGPTWVYSRVAPYIHWIESVVWGCVDNYMTPPELNEYITTVGHPPDEVYCSKPQKCS